MARGGAPALGSLCAADSRAGGPRSMAPHGLILTITIALGAAFLGGFVAARFRLPPIVGYLAAGIAVGPFTPGLSADPAIASELAEVGVILLMFGVGVHFSLEALFGVLMIAVGTRVIPWLLEQVARTGHRELFTLAVLVVALGVAVVAAFAFEVSLALGAFLAGVAISESDLSHQAAAEALPLRDAFAVLFFVSVGMLFDPTFVVREPLLVAAVVALIVVRKWLVSSGIVLALGYPIRTALIVGAGLAQIGEFSFVLSELDRQLGILPAQAHDLIIASAIITIALNSLLVLPIHQLAERLRDIPVVRGFDDRRAGTLAHLERDRAEKLQRHAVVAGHGRVGSLVTRALQRRNMEVLVVEEDRRVVDDLREAGTAAIYGDAGHALVLDRAHLERAILLVVALRDPQTSRRVVEYARRTNERLGIVARAHTRDAADFLKKAGANEVVLGEEEVGIEMTGYALHRLGVSPREIALIARGLRAR